ncbi:type II toxin-antitoxin system toxin DNA ADP-ribosyl transferase DarT [Rhodocaloribacter sp.]
MNVPAAPKLVHIVHVDRLPSIVADGFLWCDAEVQRRRPPGTGIGMNAIKLRRLEELQLTSRPGLYVGQCVPFYFCPRSVMLYLLHQGNHPELSYRGGQAPIVHLVADLHEAVVWAESEGLRWAFTLSNAGSYYFEDRCDLARLHEIDWKAVQARDWQTCKEGKQAEFLVEHRFPWHLVQYIGVYSERYLNLVRAAVNAGSHRPLVKIRRDWYY